MAENFIWFFSHPIVWGCIALILIALQFAGVITLAISRLLLVVTWLIATVSTGAYLAPGAPISHRFWAGLMMAVPLGTILFLLERWVTKKVKERESSESIIVKKSEQEIADSLKGLVAKAERMLLLFESQTADVKYSQYGSFNAEARKWQQEVESFVNSNFPEHYFNTLNFDPIFTPDEVHIKINVLKNEIKKLEN
jgi:hypothetical protein